MEAKQSGQKHNLIIAMNNDAVRIYNISEGNYINLVGDDPKNLLQKHCVKTIDKNDFSSDLLTGDASLAKFYYYDDGFTMVKKDIKDISEIEYYLYDSKLWPSKNYYLHKVKKAPKIEPLILELTEADYKLNKSIHVRQIFQDEELDAFKEYYDNQKLNANVADILKGKSYKVDTYMKLILNNSKMGKGKLTAQKLKECLCLIVTPVGKNKDGEILYSISEFELKNYIDKINSEFIKIKNQNNIKADEMTDGERYDFLESACKEVISKVQDDVLERTNELVFNSNSTTWQEYSDKFLINYKFSLTPIDLKKWKIYKETLLDSRTVHNGFVVQLVEEYALNKSDSKKKIESVERMSSSELLESQSDIDKEKNVSGPFVYPQDTYTVDKTDIIEKLLRIDPINKPTFKLDDLLQLDTSMLVNSTVPPTFSYRNNTYEEEPMYEESEPYTVSTDEFSDSIYSFGNNEAFQDISTDEDLFDGLTEEEIQMFKKSLRRR